MGALRRTGARAGGRRLSSSPAAAEPSGGHFAVERRSGPTHELVARRPPPGGRCCVICEPTGPALVLGSTQRHASVDRAACHRHGADVVVRSSGGGAVYVAPGAQWWLDWFLPAGDPLLVADLARSFDWLGRRFEAAFASVGLPGRIERAVSMAPTSLSTRCCFAGLGPGELTLNGRKVVGISQRRDRHGAWFHSMVMRRDLSDALVDCLGFAPAERAAALAELRASSAVVDLGEELLDALTAPRD